jgi:hypothetical protein
VEQLTMNSTKCAAKPAIIGLLIVALAAGVSRSSLAAQSGTAEERAACTPDVLRLCFFEIPDQKRIVACLNRKTSELSPACHDVMAGKSAKKKSRR